MNIKKLFAVLAGVSMLATQFIPAGALAATYSAELQGAYDWAYSKSITTMSSIDNANMYGAITRAELAKMLANWAKDEGKTPDTSKACNFTDTASVKGDLATAIVESCQLGLMGQGITAFRPYDTISRAEFGTALSRALWGSKYDGATPYYANHLAALKAAGIMNQISNAESTKEVRGYVMLMLQRSEGSEGSSSEVSESDKLMGCLEKCGKDVDCISACYGEEEENKVDEGEEVVKAGSLVVSADSVDSKVFIGRASDLDVLTFKTSEEVEISKVVLERYGYSTVDNINQVWLENEEGVKITEPEGLNSKGQVKLTIKKDYRKVDGEMKATIVVLSYDAASAALAGAPAKALAAGATVGFKVVDATSTAKDLDLGNYKPATYEAMAFDGAKVTVTQKASATDKTYNFEAGKMYEVIKFKVEAPNDSAIKVSGFTLENKAPAAGTKLDLNKYFDEAEVTIAGEEVSKLNAEANKSDELVISFKDVEIAAKTKAEVIVKIALSDDLDVFGNKIRLELTKLNAVDSKVSSRVDPTLPAAPFTTYVINGGKIEIDSKNLGNVEAFENSTDILVAEGEITTTQAIKSDKNGVKITVDNTNSAGSKKVVKAMRIVIAGEEYEGTRSAGAGTNDVFSFPAIEIDHASKIKVLVDTIEEGGTKGNSVTFTIAGLTAYAAGVGFYYDNNNTAKDPADMAGSLNFSTLVLTPSKATLTNSIMSDEAQYKVGKTNKQTIFKGTYTAKKADIYLNEFALVNDTAADWHANHKLTASLYLGGKLVKDADLEWDATANAGAGAWIATATFDPKVLVEAGKSVEVEVVARVEADTVTHGITETKFNLTLRGEDSLGNENSGEASKQTSKVSIVVSATPEVETPATAAKTVLLRGTEGAIAEFTVKPSGTSDMDLESVSFNKPAGIDCENLKLTVGSVDENFVLNAGKCEVTGFVENIAKAGEVVRIEFENEPTFSKTLIKAEVKGLVLNNTPITKEFAKGYADAIISFNQKNDTDVTTFTIASIDKYNSSAEVLDLHFYDENGNELKTNGLVADNALSVDDTKFTISDLKSSVYIKKIAYKVKKGTDIQDVVVNYNDYPAYFKTNDGDLKVYAYGDSGLANVAAISVAPAIAVATTPAGNIPSTTYNVSGIQTSITLDGHNVKGTIKKLASNDAFYGALGFDPSKHGAYFVSLLIGGGTCASTTVYDSLSDSYKALDGDCTIVWAVNPLSVLKVKTGDVIDQYYFDQATFEE